MTGKEAHYFKQTDNKSQQHPQAETGNKSCISVVNDTTNSLKKRPTERLQNCIHYSALRVLSCAQIHQETRVMGIPLESKEDASNGTSKGPLLPTASRRNSANPSRGTSAGRASRSGGRLATDSIGHYLSSIGRVPLLTAAEEIELAHHVQAMKELLDIQEEERTPKQRHRIRMGKRARDRMMAANLRLVVSVAKKYQNQGLELLDLVQEGAIGLERAVDKFDPAMGYKFSTYAYWWIRQGMTRAIDNSARTIRLPIHISEKLSKMRKITRELSHRFGRQPNRLELAHAMGIEPRDLEELIAQSAPCASLDAHARGEEDRSTLGELIPDPNGDEPMEGMDRSIQKEHLGGWLSQLNEREQKILRLRFGLGGEEPLTLAEIGRQINVSRERVRQLESKAILKLRTMTNHQQAA